MGNPKNTLSRHSLHESCRRTSCHDPHIFWPCTFLPQRLQVRPTWTYLTYICRSPNWNEPQTGMGMSPIWKEHKSLPKPVQGSPFQYGVPVLSAASIWGRVWSVPKLERTPNRFGLVTEQSPNRFRDPRFGMGMY